MKLPLKKRMSQGTLLHPRPTPTPHTSNMATCTRAVFFFNRGCVGSACLVLLHAIAQARCGCLFFAAVFFGGFFQGATRRSLQGLLLVPPFWLGIWHVKTIENLDEIHPQFLQFLFPHGFSMVREFRCLGCFRHEDFSPMQVSQFSAQAMPKKGGKAKD